MRLKIKRLHADAKLPSRANPSDAGLDLYSSSNGVPITYSLSGPSTELAFVEYGTGIAVEIPDGYVGLIFPRSSITNKAMILKNSVGVIDSGYRGEIRFRFVADELMSDYWYRAGDRIGQLVIVPFAAIEKIEEVDTLSPSERGTNGFGSSGEK